MMNTENNILKKSKMDHASGFKISRMKEKIKATHPHKHDHYHEIIFLTAGAGFHTIDLKSLSVQPPQLFLVKAGEVHCWEFTAIPKGFVLIFRSDFLVHLASSDIISGFEQLRNSCFDLQNSAEAIDLLFKQMEKEFNSRQPYSNRIIASFLEILLTQMIRLSRQKQKISANNSQKLVNDYQQLIYEHLFTYHLVQDYAELLHITPKHLNEVCTSVTEKTASKILTDAITLEAKRRLLYTHGTVADIAYALGFNDASNFGSFFKHHANIAPGRFRQAML
jgi:AraC-like DNA-binding protein